MLSLASLLNPVDPGALLPTPPYRSSPALSSPSTSCSDECTSEPYLPSSWKPPKIVNDSGGFVKSKAKGTANFPPFENLDEASLRDIKRYEIYPFGNIQEHCRQIPYNSKKDFYKKTGKESFDVFQYIFKAPSDDSEYTVMWDYNAGLVHMTPFFKCCKYSKRMPAKMLDSNPGLRDITHTITGGSIMAQGYWMPFACAKAVCATFCSPIAGALIPIFGPDFPSQCISPDAPDYRRMTIDPAVITESACEADMCRRMLVNANAVASNYHLAHHPSQQVHYNRWPALSSPRLVRRGVHRPGSSYDYDRKRIEFGGLGAPPYGVVVDSGPEIHSGPGTPPLVQAPHRSLPYSPISPPRSSGWTAVNHATRPHASSTSSGTHCQHGLCEELQYPGGPNPLLSAIPRFGDHYQTAQRLAPISQALAALNHAQSARSRGG